MASAGGYFFGDRPSSLDAKILAQVLYHRDSPLAPTCLKEELGKHAALLTYVQRLADEVFSTPPPPPLPQGAGVGNGGPGPDPADKATEDPEFVRQRNLWLLMAATVVGAYVLFGDVVGIDLMYEEDEDDGEGE